MYNDFNTQCYPYVNGKLLPSGEFAGIESELPARETTIPPATGGSRRGLQPTNKSNPCFCGDTSGDCRHQSNGGMQCQKHPDGTGENAEWKFVRNTTGSYFAGIYHRRRNNDFDPIAYREKKAEREAREREVERQRLEKCLTPEQRHTEIQSILNQLSLSNADRQYLEKRNVPAKIIANCRSVAKGNYGHELSNPVHINLPGVWRNGKGLSIPYSGILVPIADHLGRFIGLRLHDPTKTQDAKYCWLSSAKRGIKPNLPNGELPAATHYPGEVTQPKTLALVEGMEIKAPAAADRLGMVTMGFSGHNAIANSPQQIQTTLDHIGATEIIIIPDDNCLTNESVWKSLITTIEYRESKGYTVKVAWWGQTEKGIGDIDEIPGDRPIYYIDKAGFEWQKYQADVRKEQNKLNTLSQTPDILVNSRYFPPLAEMTKGKPLPESGMLEVKGPKGSGKTIAIKGIKNHYVSLGYEVVSIVPRVSLGMSQGNVLDLQCLNDLKDTGMSSGEVNTCMRNMTGVVLCPESLHRIQGRDFTKPHLIILDEVEQTLKQILTSSTIKNKPKTLKIFQETIKTVLDNGGIVLLSDADLTDVSIDYINDLGGGNIPTFLIKNEVKPQPINIDFYQGNRHDIGARIINDLANGKKLAIATDSRSEAQAIARVIQSDFPGKPIMEINGDTTEDPAVKEWVGDINKAIGEVKPIALIYTGSLGTGVSIDIDWFNQGYGTFFHQEPNDCGQYMSRVRSPIPWAIYAKEYVARDESHRSYRPDVIKRNLLKDKEFGLDLIIGMARETAGEDADDMQVLATLNSMRKDGQWDNPHIDLFAKMKARKNYAVSQLSDNLLAKLTEEGHNITIHQDDGPNAISTSIKEAKKEIKLEESAAIANAPDLTDQELKSLGRKPSTTKDERAKITKALISRELPGMEITQRFVYNWIVKDHRKQLNATKLFFYCQNPAIAKQLDVKEWRYRLKQFGEGCPYLPDVKTFSTKVKVINDIGLFDLLDLDNTDREYRATDDDIQAFMAQCYLHRYRLNRSLGVTVTHQTEPLALLGRLARRVGLGLTRKQYREGDDRVWAYKLDRQILENPEREKILKILAKKYAESPSDKEFSVSQNFSGECNNPTESSVTEFSPKTQTVGFSTLPNVDRLKISPQSTWDEIISTNNDQIAQLGWDVDTAGQILKERYGHPSRLKLSDAQLFDWLDYCQSLLLIQISKKVG
jgi:hypothetical protein